MVNSCHAGSRTYKHINHKEDIMKTGTSLKSSLAMVIGSASTAFAASGAREDNSGIFVWIFLGFCALIVAAQLIPAVMVTLGFAKGISKEREVAHQTATK